MASLSKWIVATFASPAGIFALAILDSTLFFSLPFGIDAAVIVLAARSESLAWLVPALATAGSLVGAAFTYWMGAKAGDAGLERYIPARRLEHVRRKIKTRGAVALAALNVIPPPFPFTPFVLAAGALSARKASFFTTLGLTRLARFGLESWLAVRFGQRIIAWLDSPVLQYAVAGAIVIAIGLTAATLVQLYRSSRPRLA